MFPRTAGASKRPRSAMQVAGLGRAARRRRCPDGLTGLSEAMRIGWGAVTGSRNPSAFQEIGVAESREGGGANAGPWAPDVTQNFAAQGNGTARVVLANGGVGSNGQPCVLA